jgi:hypothetical protein
MDRARIVVIGIVQTMTSRLRLRGETTYLTRQALHRRRQANRQRNARYKIKHALAITRRRSGSALKSESVPPLFGNPTAPTKPQRCRIEYESTDDKRSTSMFSRRSLALDIECSSIRFVTQFDDRPLCRSHNSGSSQSARGNQTCNS